MRKLFFMVAVALLASCQNSGSSTITSTPSSDSIVKSIDSSAIINDSSVLPGDSSAVNVTH